MNIERLKRLVQRHLILAYILAYLIIVCEFGCMAYLVWIDSEKMLYLGSLCFLTAWIIAVRENIRMNEEVRREAYQRVSRRINRYNW